MTEEELVDLLMKRVHGSRGRDGVRAIIRGTREHDEAQRGKVEQAIAGSRGTVDVAAERVRQILDEGFTSGMDDDYCDRSLGRAGACYAIFALDTDVYRAKKKVPPLWPWSKNWWKPTSRRRDLVKAAALLIAEIDRLDRGEVETQ